MAKRRTTKKTGLKTWQKVALVGGAGLTVYAIVSAMTKPTEPQTTAPPTTDPTTQYTAPITAPPVTIPPETVQPSATESSFKLIKDYFLRSGLPILQYTDSIELTMTYDGIPRKIKFYNNGRFFFWWRTNSAEQWKQSTAGNYSFGGKILTITAGTKAGQIKNGQDVLTNIKNAL